jgi:YHS domain-containing protein
MTITRRTMLVGLASALGAGPALTESSPAGRRIALRGYDPVSYFEDGKPAKGTPEFWYAFDDVVYFFRSEQHRAKFAADPERFAPQYNGYCAGAVARGIKTEPDPEAWLIADGRLYVFEFQERVPMFRKIISEVAAKADKAWPAMRGK